MKLLIVDDEIYAIQGIIDGVNWSLLPEIDIITANSYAQALNHFVAEPIDILLCDIEMPYGSGLDLVEWVKEKYSKTECIFLTCHDEFDFARQAIQLQCLDYVLKPASSDKIVEVLRHALQVIESKEQSQKYEAYGKRYVNEIGRPSEGDGGQSSQNVVEKVMRYIQKNISEPLTVEEIAKTVYLSPDHLTRLFKKQQGQTLIDYMIEQRMILAKELLEQNKLTITMISAKVGYNNYSYFTKIFKKYYSMTPREYQTKFLHRISS